MATPVAESLKRFRGQFNLKQKDVANALEISQQAYNAYENGSYPSTKLILKLSKIYDVSTDYLLGRSDEPRPPKFDEKTLNLIRAMQAFQATPSAGQVPAQ